MICSLLLANGYSRNFKLSPVAMRNCIQQGTATDSAHNYGPDTNLYSWVERGKIWVNTLPKGAILINGRGEDSNWRRLDR